MQGVLAGFATIGIIIGLGFLLAQLRILDATAQGILTRTALCGLPALMVTVLGGTDVQGLLSQSDRLARKRGGVRGHRGHRGPTVLEARCRRHGHRDFLFGIRQRGQPRPADRRVRPRGRGPDCANAVGPVARPPTHRPGRARRDHPRSESRTTWGRLLLIRITGPFRNPLAVGSLVGLVLALTGIRLPVAINAPLTLVAGMAVPCMLLAYGISLRLGPRPGAGEPPIQIATLVSLADRAADRRLSHRCVPGGACRSRPARGHRDRRAADGAERLQLRHALRPGRDLARDTIFAATLLSVPVILSITWLLAP